MEESLQFLFPAPDEEFRARQGEDWLFLMGCTFPSLLLGMSNLYILRCDLHLLKKWLGAPDLCHPSEQKTQAY